MYAQDVERTSPRRIGYAYFGDGKTTIPAWKTLVTTESDSLVSLLPALLTDRKTNPTSAMNTQINN